MITTTSDQTLTFPLRYQPEAEIPGMAKLAELLGGWENTQIWLNTPHPILGGRTPHSYSNEGKLQEVLKYFITAIETGQPS